MPNLALFVKNPQSYFSLGEGRIYSLKSEQVIKGNPKCFGELFDIHESDVSFASFYAAYIGTV
jgi:hypothetical protein